MAGFPCKFLAVKRLVRCSTRGGYQGMSSTFTFTMWIRLPTLTLKPRRDGTRDQNQWPQPILVYYINIHHMCSFLLTKTRLWDIIENSIFFRSLMNSYLTYHQIGIEAFSSLFVHFIYMMFLDVNWTVTLQLKIDLAPGQVFTKSVSFLLVINILWVLRCFWNKCSVWSSMFLSSSLLRDVCTNNKVIRISIALLALL